MGEMRAVKVVSRGKFHEDAHAYEREFKGLRLYEPISRSHESLVQILHVGRDDAAGCFYYVMELADDAQELPNTEIQALQVSPNPEQPSGASAKEGSSCGASGHGAGRLLDRYRPRTLKLELDGRGRLPAKECIAIGAALATALEQLHRNKLVHRDIKPSNVIFLHGRPKLADIGLVTAADASLSFVGTLGFVAPEGPGTPKADIFALGKVLYEMSMGRDRADFPALPPLDGLSESERKHLRELNAVILKAAAPLAARRHDSARELRDELLRLQLGVSIERQRMLERAYARLKVVSGWMALLILLSIVIFGVWSYRGRLALREGLLAQAKLERKGARFAGWFSNNWALIERAAAIRQGPDVWAVAAGALAGLDATPLCQAWDTSGGSAAFASDGRLLMGGVQGSPAWLVATDGTRRELPVRAEGPVGWTPEGVPLQFSATSNACLLQEVLTGNIRRTFPLAPSETVNQARGPVLAMAGNGRRVAAALKREDLERVVVWNAATGEVLGERVCPATVLAFSPDATLLAAADQDGSIEVHSLPAMTRLMVLPPPGRPTPIRCLALTPDRLVREAVSSNPGRWLLAAGYKGGEVVIWDLQTQIVRTFCRGLSWNVASLVFDPDGLTIIAGGRSEVRIWDTMSGKELLWINHCGLEDCRALALSSDGTRLAWGTDAGATRPAIGLLELNRNRGIHILRGLNANARCVWFSGDSRQVAAISDDWQVGIWEAKSDRLVNIFEVPRGVLADSAGGAFDPSGRHFAFAAGTEARLYELGTGGMRKQWRLPKSGLMDQLQFDRAGRLLWLRRSPDTDPPGERKWQLYELGEGQAPVLLHQQAETNWVPYGTAFAPGGTRFFVWTFGSSGNRPVFRAYDVASGQEVWRANGGAPNLCVDPTGRWMAYSVETGQRYKAVQLPDFKECGFSAEECEALGPSGNMFAKYVPEGHIILNRPGAAPGLLMVSDSDGSFRPSFSSDGTLFAWGTFGGAVMVAEVTKARERLASLRPSAHSRAAFR
jgi:WD40 repeat protein